MDAYEFKVGDRVRVLSHDPWAVHGDKRPCEILGTILFLDEEGTILVHHDLCHPKMHVAGGLDPSGCGYWYFNPAYLESLGSLSINPELDLGEIL